MGCLGRPHSPRSEQPRDRSRQAAKESSSFDHGFAFQPRNVPLNPFVGSPPPGLVGIENLARDSDGGKHTGEVVETVRRRHHRNRMRAQRKGAKGGKGAKKRLKRLAMREARFRQHQNHVISKGLVATAKDTDRGIGMEDLIGMRADRIPL